MNKDYSQIDQILDEIILGKAPEGKLAELINDENRDELLDEMNVHQAAAALVQRNAVLLQVSRVHDSFSPSYLFHSTPGILLLPVHICPAGIIESKMQ